MTSRVELFKVLKANEQRGSKPRCHLLTHGRREEVAEALTRLIDPFGEVAPDDRWMPQGFDHVEEAQLHTSTGLLSLSLSDALKAWWLAVPSIKASTPSIDIASTCKIGNRAGLLLIEAKAHSQELIKEKKGKVLSPSGSMDSRRNHIRIGACIQEANLGLSAATGLVWALSRDWNYQISNRFTWAWKLAELGVPVILVYLGFLSAGEMADKNSRPFASHNEWGNAVRDHGAPLFPATVWERPWQILEQPFIPLIRSLDYPLDETA